MNLYLRLIITLIKACFRRRTIQFGEKTIWKGRVLPNDIDVYGHLNSGRYVTLAGLAAFDHVLRTREKIKSHFTLEKLCSSTWGACRIYRGSTASFAGLKS